MQTEQHRIQDPLAERVSEPAWSRWLDRHQRTIALCGTAFIAGIAVGAGGRSRKTAVVVRVHNQVRVMNRGRIGVLVRAARGR
jgi:hypothetical protein